jgi:ABC-type nickel/cobalt efflux system permease component RcnA
MDRAFARELTTARAGAILVLAASVLTSPAWSHDIPNQRVDRAIQVEIVPHKLQIDYEVSLTELTLVQDLRALMGTLPKTENGGWLDLYGKVTGPLNAKGILVSVDGQPAALTCRDFHHVVEEHPRFTFHFDLPLPDHGRIEIRDNNFASSEGTSRLAVRSRGVAIKADGPLPVDVNQIAARPVWQLSDDEERRTKQVEFDFQLVALGPNKTGESFMTDVAPLPPDQSDVRATITGIADKREANLPGLSQLLDASGNLPWFVLGALALTLGAVHALQPGHGKTLVTAMALGPNVRFYQPAMLGLATTIAHMGSVLLIAAILWYTGKSDVASLHLVLGRIAGFAIAAAGFWRLGRHFGGYSVHDFPHGGCETVSDIGIVGLGLAGGLVPCWDAVALIVLAAALGRLAAGVALVIAFSLGMGVVLVTLGILASKTRWATFGQSPSRSWQTGLALASASSLAAIGLFLFLRG